MSCAGQQRGGLVPIIIDYETTYGSDPGSPAAIQIPYISESITGTRTQNEDDSLDGRRDPKRPSQGNTDVTGSITVPVDVNYFPYWLKAMFGAPTTTGSGPYTHEFKIDSVNCQPSMVLQKDFSDISQFFKYNGLKTNSMAFEFSGDGLLQCVIDLVGSTVIESGTDYDSTPTTHNYQRFRFQDLDLNEGGSATGEFVSLSLNIGANLQTDIYPIGNGGTRASLPEGKYSIGGNGRLLFDNMTMYNKAKNSTESSIECIGTIGTNTITIDMNEVEYSLASPQVEGNTGVFLNLDFQAYFDDHADDSAIVFTVVNGVASYA